jgi:tetratricopeptide (TPR) repeat protein
MWRVPRSLTTHIDSPKELGGRLKAAREQAGLSQRQLAFPGCTAAYISRLEAGARVPSLQMINELAGRLEVSGQWLATGIEDSSPAPTQLIDAEVAMRLGEIEEAEGIFRAHLEPGDPSRPAAIAGLGQIAFRAELWEQAIDLLEQALSARHRKTLVDPGAVDSLGRAYANSGALELAISLFDAALAEATEAGARIEQLRFSVLLANALIDSGDVGRAATVLADVISIADGMDDPVAAARVHWSQSRLHSTQGEPQLASRYARRALEILERTENDAYVGMAYHLLAHAEIASGNGAHALELLERGRQLFGHDLGPRDDARFSVDEARALTSLGRNTEAARVAAHALDLMDVLSPGDRGQAYVTLADVFLAAGDTDRPKMLLQQALELLRDYGPGPALEAGRRLADLLEQEGDTVGALRVLKRATAALSAAAGETSNAR